MRLSLFRHVFRIQIAPSYSLAALLFVSSQETKMCVVGISLPKSFHLTFREILDFLVKILNGTRNSVKCNDRVYTRALPILHGSRNRQTNCNSVLVYFAFYCIHLMDLVIFIQTQILI